MVTTAGWIRSGAVSGVECKVRQIRRTFFAGASHTTGFDEFERNLATDYWTHSDEPIGAIARNLDRAAPAEHSITSWPLYGATTAFAPGGFPCCRAPTRERFPLVMMTGIFDDHYETDCLNIQAETATT
jgi:hypothetical protein